MPSGGRCRDLSRHLFGVPRSYMWCGGMETVLEWEKIWLISEKLITPGDQSTFFYEIEILSPATKTLVISSYYLKGLKNHKSG